jgi:hypothetical protein
LEILHDRDFVDDFGMFEDLQKIGEVLPEFKYFKIINSQVLFLKGQKNSLFPVNFLMHDRESIQEGGALINAVVNGLSLGYLSNPIGYYQKTGRYYLDDYSTIIKSLSLFRE